MSESRGTYRPLQEEDRPNVLKLVATGLGTLAVFAAGVVYVIIVLRGVGRPLQHLGGPLPKQTGSSEIGVVDQPIFVNDRRLQDLNAAKRAWLNEYGWTDRDAGTIHVPVSRIVDEMMREQPSR